MACGTLNALYGCYHIPLMVVENGLGAFDTVEDEGQFTIAIASITCVCISKP